MTGPSELESAIVIEVARLREEVDALKAELAAVQPSPWPAPVYPATTTALAGPTTVYCVNCRRWPCRCTGIAWDVTSGITAR